MRAIRILACITIVVCCRSSAADDTFSPTDIAEKLDACPVVPADECGRFVETGHTPDNPTKSRYSFEVVFFTKEPNCCEYIYNKSRIYARIQNPKYSCFIDITGEAKSLMEVDMTSRPELARTWAAHRVRGLANPVGQPGLAVDSKSVDLSIYYGFANLTHLGLDWFSDLLLDTSLSAACRSLGNRDIEITGRRIKPPAERITPSQQVEDFTAVVRVAKDGTYAYLLSGTIRYSKPLTFAEIIVRNEVEETPTHPRLLSSKHTATNRSTSPPTIDKWEKTYFVGPEHTKGHQPLFRLSDFGLPEPDPAVFLPPPAPPPADRGIAYLWLFVLPPVGIFLVLLGRRLKPRLAAPAPPDAPAG